MCGGRRPHDVSWIQSGHDGVFPVHFLHTQACLWWWWWWGEGYRGTHAYVRARARARMCMCAYHNFMIETCILHRINFISLGTLHTCCKNSDTPISLQALSNPAHSFHLYTFINPATKQFLWKKRQTLCCLRVTARTDL